jgi:hypothetical protein
MKISRIELTNFQGLRSARLQLTKPVLMATGANGAGKSSLLEGIRLALLGNPERVGLKKELSKLVTEGAKRGGVDVITENQLHFAYTLPDGKHTAPAELGNHIGFVLDAQNFARATPDVRRATLFALTGCKVDAAEVTKRLIQRGATQERIDLVLPMLRSGFPAAEGFAKEQATQARGAWRAVTGETYGEKKADGWKPEAIACPDQQEMADLNDAVIALSQEKDRAQETLGRARQISESIASDRDALAKAIEKANQLPRHKQKLAVDQAELDKWEAKVAEAKAAYVQTKPAARPTAKLDNAMLDAFAVVASEWLDLVSKSQGVVNNFNVCENWDQHAGLINRTTAHVSTYKAQHGEPLTQDDSDTPDVAAPNAAALEASRNMFARAVANDLRDIVAAEAAEEQAQKLTDKINEVKEIRVSDFVEAVNAATEKLKAAEARLDALKDAAYAFTTAQTKEADAARHHADVAGWLLIADALSPSGIPAEILAGALRPANDALHQAASFVDWPRVQISTDMEITAAGRPYALLSESEKWRADCLLALTIAKLSGLKLIVLDRFDVLDMQGRNDLIDLLDDAATSCDIETAIVAGTLKTAPTGMPETFDVAWIENGEINNLKLDGEQAA